MNLPCEQEGTIATLVNEIGHIKDSVDEMKSDLKAFTKLSTDDRRSLHDKFDRLAFGQAKDDLRTNVIKWVIGAVERVLLIVVAITGLQFTHGLW